MKIQPYKTSYFVEVPEKDFLRFIDEDEGKLYEALYELVGVSGIDYNPEFGNKILFSIEHDDDGILQNATLIPKILEIIQSHIYPKRK